MNKNSYLWKDRRSNTFYHTSLRCFPFPSSYVSLNDHSLDIHMVAIWPGRTEQEPSVLQHYVIHVH